MKKFKIKQNSGMTYVELIVVLSIFSVLSSVVIFNYGDFQAKVDIKNLASDIALKVVEAQKMSLSGKLPPLAQQQSQIDSTWKPSYGVYFNSSKDIDTNPIPNNPFYKEFVYFADLGIYSATPPPPHNTQNGSYDTSSCPGSGECLDNITITKNNYIDKIEKCSVEPCDGGAAFNTLSITFKRPDSKANFLTTPTPTLTFTGSEYVQITIKSPKGITALIKLYPSGRVQVN